MRLKRYFKMGNLFILLILLMMGTGGGGGSRKMAKHSIVAGPGGGTTPNGFRGGIARISVARAGITIGSPAPVFAKKPPFPLPMSTPDTQINANLESSSKQANNVKVEVLTGDKA